MRSILFFMVILLFGCQETSISPMGKSADYFPSELNNGPGAIWKYYVHMTPEGGQRKTNIKYRKLECVDSKLYLKDHTADFQESYNEVLTKDNGAWRIDSTYSYDYRGSLDSLYTTLIYDIGDRNTILNWEENTAQLERSISRDNWINHLNESHSEVSDTVVDGKKVKRFYGKLESNFISDKDTTLTTFTWRREFTEGRGMTAQYVVTENMNYEWQLDEILSVDEFEDRSNHGTYRIAYIDPQEAIDDSEDFMTCYHISKINDYYNDDRAEHLGAKGGLWEMLDNNLNVELLDGQEGYLTYRFVVNCHGEAGRFITEEADLEYNRIEFSDDLRSHLLKMLTDIPLWKNLTINGEPRDAYVYVTFKIKDNEIIEILP